MLDTLITNKTRIKLLIRFFLNPGASSYLRGLEEEFGESTNAIRIELNRFEAAGLLVTWLEKNRKMFAANTNHPLFHEIHNILVKHTGIDSIVTTVIRKAGNIETAYARGVMARDPDSQSLELIIFGKPADPGYLVSLAAKASLMIRRDIRCTILPVSEEPSFTRQHRDALLIWKKEREAGEE